MIPRCALLIPASLLLLGFSGCVNSEGRFRPPDPLGRAIFDALDRGPYPQDRRYVGQPEYTDSRYRPGSDYVWVEGAYARDSNGRNVWVPGHWARVHVR